MKSIITSILLVTFLSVTAFAQSNFSKTAALKSSFTKPTNSYYSLSTPSSSRALKRYSSTRKSGMRKTGIILLSAGAATLTGGIILGSTTGGFSYSYDNTNGEVTEEGKPINGVAGIINIIGGAATITGTVFTIIGQHRINKEKERFSLNVYPNGFDLCYRF